MSQSDDDPGQRSTLPPGPPPAELAERIRKAREEYAAGQPGRQPTAQKDMSTLARGLRIGTEFVAAILVGTGIGYAIDQMAGTMPWATLIMFMLGFAAGILNVTRVVAELGRQSSAAGPDDERPGHKE